MSEVVAFLKRLGFAEYEAKAYVALLRQSPLSGYELARASGIPRADTYAVLQRLEDRGAVLRLDTEGATRYVPVAAADLLHQLESRFKENLEASRSSLESLAAAPEYEHILNSRGYSALLEQARALIKKSRQTLLVATFPQEASEVSRELAEAQAMGVEITTFCLQGCPTPCGHCSGHLHRYTEGPTDGSRWLVVVPDGEEVLAGEIGLHADTLSTRTRQGLLVRLISHYIQNSIALAALFEDLGSRMDSLVRPDTLRLIHRSRN